MVSNIAQMKNVPVPPMWLSNGQHKGWRVQLKHANRSQRLSFGQMVPHRSCCLTDMSSVSPVRGLWSPLLPSRDNGSGTPLNQRYSYSGTMLWIRMPLLSWQLGYSLQAEIWQSLFLGVAISLSFQRSQASFPIVVFHFLFPLSPFKTFFSSFLMPPLPFSL